MGPSTRSSRTQLRSKSKPSYRDKRPRAPNNTVSSTSDSTPATEAAKRKRGRPRSTTTTAAATTTTTTTDIATKSAEATKALKPTKSTEPVTRKRGRPSKAAESVTLVAEQPPSTKRKRGRPPRTMQGTKRAVDDVEEVETDDDHKQQASDDAAEEPITKRQKKEATPANDDRQDESLDPKQTTLDDKFVAVNKDEANSGDKKDIQVNGHDKPKADAQETSEPAVEDTQQQDTSAEDQSKDKSATTESEVPEPQKPEQNGSSTEAAETKKSEDESSEQQTTQEEAPKSQTNGNASKDGKLTENHSPPSSMNEKGVLYFFMRPRVGLEKEPENFQDIQRSFIVMRPIPLKDAITSGKIVEKEDGSMRVLALPKKKLLGKGGKFMTFVEKVKASTEQIKEEVLQSSSYSTATLGDRTNPAAQPLGTAVYSITQNGTTSHLTYMIVNPLSTDSKLTPLQEDFGLKEKGSFVLSVKNPKSKSPNGVGLDANPGYSDELMEAFGTRSWNSVNPKYLDYVNAEILFIGEDTHIEAEEDEELEKLAAEDEERIKEMMKSKKEQADDDGIFKDLELSREEYGDGIKMEF